VAKGGHRGPEPGDEMFETKKLSAGATALALLSLLGLLLGFSQLAAASTKPVATRPLTQSEIRQAEQKLKDLGYWTGPIDGTWDITDRQALIAFQKVSGAKPTGVLTRAE